jgi:hypothetical protein
MKRVKNAQPKRSKGGGLIVFLIFAIIGICIVMSSCQAGNTGSTGFRDTATNAINTVAPVIDATQSAWQAGYNSAQAQINANAQSQQPTTQYPVYNPPVNVPQQTVVYQTQPVAPQVVYTTPVISYNSQPSYITPRPPSYTIMPYSPTPWINRRDDRPQIRHDIPQPRYNPRPDPRHDQPIGRMRQGR